MGMYNTVNGIICTVKPVFSSHPMEAHKMPSEGRWLFNGGKYQNKIKIWEHIVWLLKTSWLLKRGDR